MKMQRTEVTLFLGIYNSIKLLFSFLVQLTWEGGVPISPYGIPRRAQVYRKTGLLSILRRWCKKVSNAYCYVGRKCAAVSKNSF